MTIAEPLVATLEVAVPCVDEEKRILRRITSVYSNFCLQYTGNIYKKSYLTHVLIDTVDSKERKKYCAWSERLYVSQDRRRQREETANN